MKTNSEEINTTLDAFCFLTLDELLKSVLIHSSLIDNKHLSDLHLVPSDRTISNQMYSQDPNYVV